MAILHKAFLCTGIAPHAFPRDVFDKLIELSRQYNEHELLDSTTAQPSTTSTALQDPNPDDDRDGAGAGANTQSADGAMAGSGATRGKASGEEQGTPMHSSTGQGQRTYQTDIASSTTPTHIEAKATLKRTRSTDNEAENDQDVPDRDSDIERSLPSKRAKYERWTWGPQNSSEDTADFYRSVYSYRRENVEEAGNRTPETNKRSNAAGLPSPQPS